MIRNLNQVSFQGFVNILPERSRGLRAGGGEQRQTLQLDGASAPVYRCTEDVWLLCGAGMTVLSVSHDADSFQDFYLDKAVCVKAGVYFSLMAIYGTATAEMSSQAAVETVGQRNSAHLRVDNGVKVDGLYTFFYQEKERGFVFPGESHQMPELTYVDQGSLHSVADGQDLLLKQGDIVIYGPGQWHMQYADIGVAPRYVTLTFDVSGLDVTPLINRKFAAPQQAVHLLQQMLREQERMDKFSNDMILAQLTQLLLTLLRECETPSGGKLQTSNSVHSENEIIRQAQIFISSHIREKLSVPLVARQVDVSPSYLTALFHKNLQISPGEYIRRIKLQESKQMIRENDLNFTEIAAALQYSTVHPFSRQFKEKFGITPTEYAKSVR